MKSNIGRKLSLFGWGCWLSYPVALLIGVTSAGAVPTQLKLILPQPPQRGMSGKRSAAASRDKCPSVTQPLTALVPQYAANRVWGLTSMEHPTFWFYVPYPKNSIVDISFTLQDETNPIDTQIVYQNAKLTPTLIPGVMAIALPKSTVPLSAKRSYHWFMKLNMSCTIGQRPIFVEGWVQRTELNSSLTNQIEQATPTEQVNLYAANGLWYDALTTLAHLRAAKPQDKYLNQAWKNLLESIELGDLASQPFGDERRSTNPPQSKTVGF